MGIEIGLFLICFLIVVPLLGHYMAKIFSRQTSQSYFETFIYRICAIDPAHEMTWKAYAKAVASLNALGLLFLFLLQVMQSFLPLNPQSFPNVEPILAFNTAASFVTNTNWQAYGGEITMSYLVQTMGLTVQNFLSAATGNAVLLALIRGITRKSMHTIGNFWVDLTKTVLYLLMPLAAILALVLVSQGVIQNFHPYVTAHTLEGDIQTIPMGPAASQIAIKQLGTNGGGFFNANSAHPFENPTPLSNFLEALAILIIPGAATYMYGLFIKSKNEGLILFSVMLFLWVMGLTIAVTSENMANPVLAASPLLEGKEVRFGVENSILWTINTTASSNGSVNNMLSSLSPLAGGIALFNIMIGELIFGGVGVGLCGMLMFVLLTVFLAGLMVGRTPEYLGKKIEKNDIQWVMLAILTPCALILLGSGITLFLPLTLTNLTNTGPHGLSEILYAFSSSAGNNGSAFSGLNANTPYYNAILGIIMILSRLAILIPSLAIAGNLAKKTTIAPSLGTFSTNTLLFALLLICIILIVGALTFFPALSLGPIIEQFLMLQGKAL